MRVYILARQLAAVEHADSAIVETAALLHDISRQDEDLHATGDHAVLAADYASDILRQKGADEDFIKAVAHCIAAHRYRNAIEPQTIEAQVLFDADKLDSLGATGIARIFAYGGHVGSPLWAEVSPDYQQGGEEAHTPRHEYEVKLKHVKDRLYTASGRALAEERHAFMAAFFERMSAEVAGQA